MKFFQFAYVVILGHLFVWGPFAVIDRLFCHGKMFADLSSMLLVELVALTFVAAKLKQSWQTPKN